MLYLTFSNVRDVFCFVVIRFAKLTAAVLLRCEIPVYLFSKIIPTPFVVSISNCCWLYLF